ncbi:carboxypeptidase N subunit 2-like [Tribolium castaneum]|uniref:Chaoptin-like Protein n=1 Tax=Tribolium castaneum TaxID=7070 RepID=D6WRC8_TRICA|nr:PREDICTED: carboxypeptidase N subunit 2-like [Tribolium castaneum]EFA06549.1 Chaoptin-like Protein [Tribolium castaneum]|eukprot:XP_015836722.1 PREDICTED: carboxypeptidase N subunit 2-like [Tribolium castaneum]
MTGYYFLSLTLLATCCSFVLCDFYKNVPLTKSRPFSDEQIKNQLDHVHLTYKNIPVITPETFHRLSPVKKLEVEFCNVKSIDEDSFRALENLQKLSLKHNLLTEIPNGTFSATNIEELDLSDNQIEKIESGAFGYMPNLRSIKLKNNKIQMYHNSWFELAPNLCFLNLENNLMTALPTRILGSRQAWTCNVDVIFSHNSLEEIDEEAFLNYKLNKLYLDHNKIRVLPKNVFSNAVQISHLKLNNNRLDCTLPEMSTVEKYDVNDNSCLFDLQGEKLETSTPEASTTERVLRYYHQYQHQRDFLPPPFHPSMGRNRYNSFLRIG